MKLTPHVTFVIEMIDPVEYKYKQTIYAGDFKHFVSLQNMIDCIGLIRAVPCAFEVTRQVYFTTDVMSCNDVLKVNGQDITTDRFKFIVADKLPYMEDLQQYLLKNFSRGTTPCQDVHFKNFAQFNTSRPIFFTGPYEYNASFLPDQPLDKRPLTARPLTDKDVVLDKKLNQIWPAATNKPPKELLALLAKTKEEIR